jgi:hypothetical protein
LALGMDKGSAMTTTYSGTAYVSSIHVRRADAQIVCEPDVSGLLAYALGFACSEMHIQEHARRFAPNGPGLLVNDHLAITRVRDIDDLPSQITPEQLPALDSHEIWVIERPRGFGQNGAAIAMSGNALRDWLAEARGVWQQRKREHRANAARA